MTRLKGAVVGCLGLLLAYAAPLTIGWEFFWGQESVKAGQLARKLHRQFDFTPHVLRDLFRRFDQYATEPCAPVA
jgi:hypothetical protein